MKKFSLISAFLLSFSLLGVAQAKNPCKDEVKKLCEGIEPGGGRIKACIKEKQEQLSPECKAKIEARIAKKGKKGKDPCRADSERLCKEIKPGEGRIKACLFEKQDQLSAECKAKIDAKLAKRPCAQDTLRLCKGVKPGEGRLKACLFEKQAQLSVECKAKIDAKLAKRPCAQDAMKLCQGVKPGEGRIKACLKEKQDQVSPECKARIEAKKAKKPKKIK